MNKAEIVESISKYIGDYCHTDECKEVCSKYGWYMVLNMGRQVDFGSRMCADYDELWEEIIDVIDRIMDSMEA